jgi:hypothetical protein
MFSAGCTPRYILYVDGYPAPEEMDVSWSSDGAIQASWYFSRWYPKKLESGDFTEYVPFPEHLSGQIAHHLPADTQHVVLNLNIYNISRKKYRLVSLFEIENQATENFVSEWTIRESQSLVIPAPVIPDKEVTFLVRIVSGNGPDETLITTGELRYVISSAGP